MLQTIRDRTQGLIVGIIIGLVCLTFALWGVESYINQARQIIVAEVNGDEIPVEEFQTSLQRLRRQAENMLGDQFNAEEWNQPDVKMRALDSLINDRILASLIKDARISVSEQQMVRQLQQIPAFQQDGVFSRALYEQRISSLGYSPVGFERQLGSDLAQSQLRAGIAASEFTTREEALRLQRLREQKRDVGYAIMPSSVHEDQVALNDSDFEKYYNEHQESYRKPETASFEYLELSSASLAAEVKVTDDALRAYYDANHATYTTTEERNVNHILIQVSQSASEADVEAARTKADDLLKRARAGEDFEKLAREFSDDTGSKTEGGETGLFPRGAMAPQFEEAAFKLPVGEISSPVRTNFGFHLIKVKEIKGGGLRPFDEARADVEAAYRNAEAQKVFIDQAEQFSNLVYEHPDSLTVAADALNLKSQTTASMTKAEIAAQYSDKLAAAVFEADVLVDGLNSEPVEMPDGRVMAVRVIEHQPSVIPPLSEVKPLVEAEIREMQLRTLTEAAGTALIEKLRGGATIAELIKDAGIDWKNVEAAGRESADVNRAVLREAFRADVTGDKPTYLGIAIGKADYAVIRVANVQVPPVSDVDTTAVQKLTGELMKARATAAWQDYVAALRGASDVTINRNDL